MAKRAIRRHHRERLKKVRRRYWNAGFHGAYGTHPVHYPDADVLAKVVRTAKRCSCYMCGNQRWYWGKPMHDIRWDHRTGFETKHPQPITLDVLYDE